MFAILLTISVLPQAQSHVGGLDSQGGHNCRKGSCAGTYHCHQPRGDFCKKELGKKTKKSINGSGTKK
jgi:hypothetical protein